MTYSARSILLAGASLLAVGTAHAQDSDRVIVLSPIIVQADDVAGYVATGAQAAKSTLPVNEVPQSLSVVTNDQINDQGAERVGAALGYTAGVLAEPFGRDPRFDSPRIRGFDANFAQYVNGLRQGRYFGAAAQEIYGLQQVEVLRGPSSTIYGAGSPLGVINMVQKRARSFDFGEVGVGTDTNGSARLFFDANRAVSDTLAMRVTGIARDDNTQIEDLDNKGGYLATALRWTPDDATTVDVLLNYQKDSPISPTGVPFALTQVADGKDLRDLYTGQKDFDDSDREMISFGVEISHDLGNGWTLGQGLRYETFNWNYDGTYASAYTGGDTFTRRSSRQRENSDTISLDTRLSGKVMTGDVSHNLLFGADIRKYDAFESSQFGSASAINWRTGQSLGSDRTFFAPNAGDVVLRQAGAYAQDELSYGNWRGVVGLRYDWVEQEGERYGRPSEYKDNQLTGRVGLSYVMANGVTPYGTYSTSFDPQAGTDIDGNALKPTEGEQLEIGVKYRPLDFDGLFTAALYDLRQTNVNRTVARPNGEQGSGIRQIGEVKSRGLELEATAQLGAGWSMRGGYAYNMTEQIAPANDPLNGNELEQAPNNLFSLWIDHDFANGLSAGGGVRYIGDRYRNAANASKLDSVTLLDAALRYDWDNIRTSLNVTNLTDEVYVSACGFSFCSYGEGRTVSAKVAYTW